MPLFKVFLFCSRLKLFFNFLSISAFYKFLFLFFNVFSLKFHLKISIFLCTFEFCEFFFHLTDVFCFSICYSFKLLHTTVQ